MLTRLGEMSSRLLISLDWTEWHSDLRVLMASVAIGTRAIPVYMAAFLESRIPRSQNAWEESFLEVLALLLREAHVTACFLADRGFRRVRFIRLLLQQKDHNFVVRMVEKVTVETPQYRDTKGARFGFAMVWTQITTPAALARFLLLLGLTIFVLTAIGQIIIE